MMILQNLFVKAIVVPIILAFAAALLEVASALVKGRRKGNQKYRVWIKQKLPNDEVVVVALTGQSLATIRNKKDIIDIEPMASLDLADFGNLGIDLIIAALSVDLLSLINNQHDSVLIAYILIGHLFMLIGILLFLMLGHLATPEQISDKRSRSAAAIGLGLLAMIVAFFVA